MKFSTKGNTGPFAARLMRDILIIILSILLTSCFDNGSSFEKSYYEKVSNIKFPEKYKVLETFDNGEWLTGTVFKVDCSALRNFIIENHFDTLQNLNDIHLFSNNYLTRFKADFKSTKNVYFIRRSVNKNNWIYVADLNENKLWAEISYPDWGGK